MQITVTDEDKHTIVTEESFLGDQCFVTSRSGLSISESVLINSIVRLPDCPRLLILGNRTGAVGMIAQQMIDATVTMHTFDLFDQQEIELNLTRNNATELSIRCEPDISERDHFDAIMLQVSKGAMPNELIQDLLQQIHLALRDGGTCMVAIDIDPDWLRQQMRTVYGNCSVHAGSGSSPALLLATRSKPLKKIKAFKAQFTMTRPDAKPIQLQSVPGVFAHRRVDTGVQAVAEVATTQPGDRILDIGCGCGALGISLAVNEPTAHLTLIDSNIRSTLIAEQNCSLNDLTNFRVLLSNDRFNSDENFTLFVAGAYYSPHDKIAELLIHAGYNALAAAGRAYIVAKDAKWHQTFMLELFGNAEIVKRRGYQIVMSTR